MSYRELLNSNGKISDSFLSYPFPTPGPNDLIAKGTLYVGDGIKFADLLCPTTNGPTATTQTFYNWLYLANGQTKTFQVSNGLYFQPGYNITITYSATDSITGVVQTVVGNTITMTISSFAFDSYSKVPVLQTNTNVQGTGLALEANAAFSFTPGTTVGPSVLPGNTWLMDGSWNAYISQTPQGPLSNATLTVTSAQGGVINPITSPFTLPQYDFTHFPTNFSFSGDGCFVSYTGPIQLVSNYQPTEYADSIAFDFPAGGTAPQRSILGQLNGYSLNYTPLGQITINSQLVLFADSTQPLGVRWGVYNP